MSSRRRSWLTTWSASPTGRSRRLRWQVETFGFHALSLEVRQHSEVHAATLAALTQGADLGDHAGDRRRHGRRGARDLPRHRRDPGTLRAGGLPALRHQLHALPAGRLRRAGPGRAGRPGTGHPGRGPPPRVGRRAGGRGSPARRPAGRPDLSPARARAGRSPGGHAGLLGLHEGVGGAGGRLAAPRRRVAAGQRRRAPRGAPDALPRARRSHRSRRWADEPRHPGQRAALAGRAHQDHRAGRGRGRPLRQPRHRAAAPRAAHERRADGLLQRPRADGPDGSTRAPTPSSPSWPSGRPGPTAASSGRTPPSRPSTWPPHPSPSSRS